MGMLEVGEDRSLTAPRDYDFDPWVWLRKVRSEIMQEIN